MDESLKGHVTICVTKRCFETVHCLCVFGINGRGEWIRTTDLLVPNQAAFPNTMITQRILLQENSI